MKSLSQRVFTASVLSLLAFQICKEYSQTHSISSFFAPKEEIVSIIEYFEHSSFISRIHPPPLYTTSSSSFSSSLKEDTPDILRALVPFSRKELFMYPKNINNSAFLTFEQRKKEINTAFNCGATKEYFQSLSWYKTEDNNPLFPLDIGSFFACKQVPLSYVEEVVLAQDAYGDPLFDTPTQAKGIYTLYLEFIPANYVLAAAQLFDKRSDHTFLLEQIISLQHVGVTEGYLKDIAIINSNIGHVAIDATDTLQLFLRGISSDYVSDVAFIISETDKEEYYAQKIQYYFFLEASLTEIDQPIDTSKPNGVVTIPIKDDPGTFYSQAVKNIIDAYRQVYDLHIRVTSREEDVYAAIQDMSEISFFQGSGHGDGTAIQLGYGTSEEYQLDTNDIEFSFYESHFLQDAVLFIDGCYSGLQFTDKLNLIESIGGFFPEREVYGSTGCFPQNYIGLNSVFPFDATIESYYDCYDASKGTYVSTAKVRIQNSQ